MKLTAAGKYARDVSSHLWGWVYPEPPYWLDRDCDGTYCLECAKIEYGFEAAPNGEGIDGGFGGEGSGCLHCDRCGKLLEYCLTDYGTRSEIGHYIENPPKFLTAEEAYHIAKALDGAPWLPDLQGEAFAVAMRAMAAIPLLPAPVR